MCLFMYFQLPDNIRARLKRCPRITQRTYLFKNAEYLILTDELTCEKYFVQLISLNLTNVELRKLSVDTNILVISRNMICEKPDLVADQIIERITNECAPTAALYPTGFTNISTLETEPLDVGVGIYPWPSRVFSPYVDATAWPTFLISDNSNITNVLFYNMGFVVAQSPSNCTPTWGTYYPIEQIPAIEQIKQLRAKGGDITISFGGAANTPVHICAPNVETLKDIYKQVITLYSLRRIDFDIEGAWVENVEANERNAQALKMLQDELEFDIEIWLTLPVLTTGLVPSGLAIVQQMFDAGVNLTGVNIMTMDYGPPIDDMGQAAIDAMKELNTQLGGDAYHMIGTTPMIGQNDIQGEIFTIENAMDMLSFCKSKNVRMISMWSSNRDNSQGSGIPQSDNQFSITFEPYTS